MLATVVKEGGTSGESSTLLNNQLSSASPQACEWVENAFIVSRLSIDPYPNKNMREFTDRATTNIKWLCLVVAQLVLYQKPEKILTEKTHVHTKS